MSQEANITAQQKFRDAVNSGELALINELVAENVVDNDPAPGQGAGPAGYQAFFAEMIAAFPDLHIRVEHVVANDTDVAFAYTLTGTHQGPLMGHSASGKSMSVRGMQISRFKAGKLVERWGSSDEKGMLEQLGLAP
ncbi:ester cyclase [Cryobacterium sp. TMT2-18-3]|uniref:ester cyclase n=1 Tax=unclassified Cryobacterium TaxID=2649013 RepID=UPI001069F41D|nr:MULTISPECIES: ester cyclase [unclassified Cryobacterium]TFC30840.1 ester cyclase [Cryobacterium sp. TMT2-18-2]TFC38291.1 ester cyclase [Cryobacterium sp. TMT2-42-4]TFC58544.1 ester cyclase [Cryobacterium sp. TMT2-15-1]TFC66481.1 ester cyclase [Cryobacterium sp. TMT2-18-3]